ncbi:MAG: methylated-DNA--[protein]-cysteine S-methyltransferase [Desulfovibrionaceae bacterium]|nr:methylated-DNA--[protein]-cysteine S-methyltransferase [Desulfovibrionaceae bacterium]
MEEFVQGNAISLILNRENDELLNITIGWTADLYVAHRRIPHCTNDLWHMELLRFEQGYKPFWPEEHLCLRRLTPFATRVCQYVQSIPYGSIRGTQDIAEKLGMPRAARHVETAAINNPWPLLVPSHRIIGVSRQNSTGEGLRDNELRAYLLACEGRRL